MWFGVPIFVLIYLLSCRHGGYSRLAIPLDRRRLFGTNPSLIGLMSDRRLSAVLPKSRGHMFMGRDPSNLGQPKHGRGNSGKPAQGDR
jgi:hypothetical protein